MNHPRHTFVAAACLAAGLSIAGVLAVSAQQNADPVLARVDGVEIRESQLALAEADIGQHLPPSAPEARREALVTYLIDVNILAKAAEDRKLADDPEFEQRLEFARKKALMEVLLEDSRSAVSEAAVKRLYDESVMKSEREEEVRARHILVESEDEAKKLYDQLKAGADFAELAKKHSKDTGGAAQGGDLGYFARGQMVPVFEETAFALKTGEVSEPVLSQFGWHVIKVEDRRLQPLPTLEEVRDQIEAHLLRQAQAEMVMKAREAAKVERLTPPGPPGDGQQKN